MIPASEWYPHLAYLSFPMVFVPVDEEEAGVVTGEGKGRKARASLVAKLDRAIGSIPGSCFAYADVCSPTDSSEFAKTKGAVRSGEAALKLLRGSDKVKQALREKQTQRIVVRPYRRMDNVREFRLFIFDGKLAAVSQMNLERHFARLAGRREEIAAGSEQIAAAVAQWFPKEKLVVDAYLTSGGDMMILDLNDWGESDPLLLLNWDRDWSEPVGLKLIEKPTKLGGDVEVSF
jgi:hypothetical protein